MPDIKSLEDLKRIREEAIQKRQLKQETGHVQITVGMGTPGIAAGARETMKAILEFIESRQLANTIVRQTGNIGLDSWEPIVQVVIGSEPQVTYGKVTPFAATRIMEEHVLGGKIVTDYLIE
jgi:NADP-reducing hydrogenase subunit HndB